MTATTTGTMMGVKLNTVEQFDGLYKDYRQMAAFRGDGWLTAVSLLTKSIECRFNKR